MNAKRADGMTGLMLAASGWMQEAVNHWLAAGADIRVRGPGNCNALMLGARSEPIVSALLKAGADVTLVDDDGDTAIEYAMEDLSIMRAGSRLGAIQLLASQLANHDPSLLQQSLAEAKVIARKTRVEMSVLKSLGQRPMSENMRLARQRTSENEMNAQYAEDLNKFVDLEITEIELADRIVAVLENLIQ